MLPLLRAGLYYWPIATSTPRLFAILRGCDPRGCATLQFCADSTSFFSLTRLGDASWTAPRGRPKLKYFEAEWTGISPDPYESFRFFRDGFMPNTKDGGNGKFMVMNGMLPRKATDIGEEIRGTQN